LFSHSPLKTFGLLLIIVLHTLTNLFALKMSVYLAYTLTQKF